MKHDATMTAFKIIGSLSYSVLMTTASIMQSSDNYSEVFTDLFFWASAFLGTAVMLLVEKADAKTREKVTFRKVAFSIVACLCVIFLAGIYRASSLGAGSFERSFIFYALVMFGCSIAPTFIANSTSAEVSKKLSDATIDRATRMISGKNEPSKTDENEQ